MKVKLKSKVFSVEGSNAASIRAGVRTCVTTTAVALALALAWIPGRASVIDEAVWLYGPGGAYLASGYIVGGGHVSDPAGDEIGVLDQFGNVYSLDGSLIGYVVVSA